MLSVFLVMLNNVFKSAAVCFKKNIFRVHRSIRHPTNQLIVALLPYSTFIRLFYKLEEVGNWYVMVKVRASVHTLCRMDSV